MRGCFAFLLLVALACGRDVDPPRPEATTMDPATFAAVVAELAAARAQLLPDTQAYRARRDAILARHRVSAGQLEEFGASFGGNEEVLSRVYGEVEARIDTLFGSDAIAPPSTGVTPPEEEPLAQPPAEIAPPAEAAPPLESPAIESPAIESPAIAPDTTLPTVPDTS
jgi:hypothetical protein